MRWGETTRPTLWSMEPCKRRVRVPVVLVGPEKRLRTMVPKGLSIGIVHAPGVVTMNDAATAAVRSDKPNSIRVALELVRDGRACAMVSCGNSGAVLVGAKIVLGTFDGIDRPGYRNVAPARGRWPNVLLDAGANVDCRPEQLVNFALLGVAYATVYGVANPRVGVLSNGVEKAKAICSSVPRCRCWKGWGST